jgi:hypothetical protein
MQRMMREGKEGGRERLAPPKLKKQSLVPAQNEECEKREGVGEVGIERFGGGRRNLP